MYIGPKIFGPVYSPSPKTPDFSLGMRAKQRRSFGAASEE